MSSSWLKLIRQSGDPDLGSAVYRLARMAAAVHRTHAAEQGLGDNHGIDGPVPQATVPRLGRAGGTEVAR